eukprot:6800380-Lingulodinium_polyedra.AAC.1
MDTHGHEWRPAVFHRAPWGSIGLQWTPVEPSGLLWSPVGPIGAPWTPLDPRGLQMMGFHSGLLVVD